MYGSRLSRMQERRNVRKAVLLIGLTIIIVGAAGFLGIPVLTKVAQLVSSGKSDDTSKTDNIPPPAPEFTLPYSATNSAQQVITGLAEPGSTVYLTQNSYSEGNAVASTNGVFEFTNIKLFSGDNDFSAVAIDQAGNKSLSTGEAHIYYSNQPPKISLDSPTDHQIVTGSDNTVEVKGATDNAARLTVNDRNIILDSSGRFDTRFSLNSGDNSLTITAYDASGNQFQQQLTVTYNP